MSDEGHECPYCDPADREPYAQEGHLKHHIAHYHAEEVFGDD